MGKRRELDEWEREGRRGVIVFTALAAGCVLGVTFMVFQWLSGELYRLPVQTALVALAISAAPGLVAVAIIDLRMRLSARRQSSGEGRG